VKGDYMLDNYSSIKVHKNDSYNYNINAVSGTIRKSHSKSFITKVKLDDTLLDKVNPRYTISERKYYNKEDYCGYNNSKDYPVVILQVMLCGDNQCLVEFVKTEDFYIKD
jgi:hypothetical protein